MTTFENLHVAIANLMANKIRTFFSMLGIIIGTGSVIVVISIVNGSRQATLEQMRAGKDNMLILRPKYSEEKGRFGAVSIEDTDKIKRLPSILTAFPDVIYETEVRGRYGKAKMTFFGIDHYYAELYRLKLLEGRFFTEADTNSRPRICIISDKKAQILFGFDYPIGQRVRMEKGFFEVVGVFKAEERLKRMEQYGDGFVPLQTLMGTIPDFVPFQIQIRALPGKLEQAKKAINAMLAANPNQEGLLELADVRDYYKDTEQWAKTWMLQMSLVAAISLLVGGVGLMNVMLISVTERTHEIGLRKALGASSKMLLNQFLVESITLSGLGGFIGVMLGVLISTSLDVLSKGKILIAILPLSIAVSFIFSLIIGVVFGLFPASKAARLSPVELFVTNNCYNKFTKP